MLENSLSQNKLHQEIRDVTLVALIGTTFLVLYLSKVKSMVLIWRLDRCSNMLTWWRHQMETFPALLALWERNPPVTGGFPSQRPVTPRRFDVFFDLRPSKRLSKHSRRRWFETPSCSLWRHCNQEIYYMTGCLDNSPANAVVRHAPLRTTAW